LARPKSYDREEAVERACYAFWAHGYAATGVRALEQLTGLNKFAIRSEFGGKEGLYLAALKHYADAAKDTLLAPMRTGGIATVEAFLQSLVGEDSPGASAWGCLIVNTGIENAEIRSPALQAAVNDYWATLAAHFAKALRHAQAQGEIKRSINIDDAVQGLVTAVMGIHTRNRVSGRHDAGMPLVRMMLQQIRSWRV